MGIEITDGRVGKDKSLAVTAVDIGKIDAIGKGRGLLEKGRLGGRDITASQIGRGCSGKHRKR